MGDFFKAEANEALDYIIQISYASGSDLAELNETKRLNERFEMLRAMLNDSEDMKVTTETAKLSLRNLKRIFYEIEDLLDEFLYHVLDLKSDSKPSITDDTINFFREMAKRACELKIELEPIEKDWARNSRNHHKLERDVRVPSTSLPDLNTLVGRKDGFDRIKGLLFSKPKQGRNVEVIAIVGMGGLGKTKLASSVFNDGQVEDYFNKRIWVCVSEEFSAERLTSAMLEFLGDYTPYRELNTMQRKLHENVQGQKVLLILDDVWKVNNLNHTGWEEVRKPFNFSNKTKIIVTTRNEEVLTSIIQPDEVYQLPYLSDHDCFKILKYHSFTGEESCSYPILLELGDKISKKCRGLPLVAKILGRLLRGREDIKQWHDILNNPGVCADDEDVMPILRLSYQYLPAVLKKCFRFCSVFPKGCQFNKKQLANMWMANGFLTQSELGDIGEQYVGELLSSSLLERDERDEMFFTMHDMIHDLARSVSYDEWSSVEGDVLHGHGNDGFQYFSIISAENYPEELVQQNLKSRSLLVFNSSLIWPHVRDICAKFKNLRVLDMSHSGLPAILPELIGSLKHLRFLSLQGNAVTELRESMGKLHFLETLNLNGTKIEVFPEFICSLKRLRCLDLRGTPIKCLPESLGLLDRLHSLDLEFCKIDYLPSSVSNMSNLRHLTCDDSVVFPLNMRKLSQLQIVKEFTDGDVGKGTNPYNKEQVKILSLIWTDDCSFEGYKEMIKLPDGHHNVKQLCIDGFRGSSLPSRLIGHLQNLNRIDLINCESLVLLSLGNMRFLRHLHVDSARKLKYICMPTQQNQNITQSLTILDCPNLITISSSNDLIALHALQLTRCPEFLISRFETCKSLQHLSIIECHEGTNFYLGSPPSDTQELKDPCIRDYPSKKALPPDSMNDHVSQRPQISVLRFGDLSSIRHLCIKKSSHDIPDDFSEGRFQQLETLVLESLHNWTSWKGPQERQCQKLQKLSIIDCAEVRSFSFVYLYDIKELYVEDCGSLTVGYGIKKLLFIEKLYISKIHDIRLIVYGYEKLPHQNDESTYSRLWNVSKVSHLIMAGCSHLESIKAEDLRPELQAIQFHDCKHIVSINIENQVFLKYLSIRECPSLSIVMCASSMLRFLEIMKSFSISRPAICSTPNLGLVEYLHVSGPCILELSGANLILSSLKVMELEVPSDSYVTSLRPDEDKFISMKLVGMIPKFSGLREFRISSSHDQQISLPTVKFLNSLPSTLRVLEIIGPFYECYRPELPLQGLSIQRLKLKNIPYGCILDIPLTLQVLEIYRCPMFCTRSSNDITECGAFPSTLRVLEIAESGISNFEIQIPLQSSKIQQLKLKDMPNVSFVGDYVPSTLEKLYILQCPSLEYWCERNKDKLKKVKILYEEEDSFQAHTTCSLLQFLQTREG